MEPVYATPKADESKLDDYHNNRNSDHKYDYQQKASSEYGNFEQQYKNNNGRNNNLGYTDSHRSRNREKTDEANYQKSYHNSHPDNTHDKMEQNYDAQDNVDKNSPPHGRGKGAAEHKQGGDGRKYSETVTAPALLINKLTSKVPAPSVQLYHYVSEYDASNDDYSNTWYYYTMGNGGNYDDNYKYDYKSYNDYEKTKEGYEKSFSTVKTTNQESEDPLDHDQDDEETVQSWEPTTPTAVKAQTDKTSDKAKENYPITKAVSGASVKQPTEAVQKEIQNMSVEVDAELISRRTTPETSVILPLAIGLAITLVLLVMVACRLRMVKRKLRHGRPLANSQEADYLINGMYL
ncbi:uncharacterized protein LOC102804402 [Saccoglossus kowalevskii]|uniref:Probable serine/threonine-protein kinase clkA-like n=1 Tax=Saccoglossus kowalevskii TaxID=10224 RepID=A0ABM0MYG4_SACKO|nr:PREDICTED: probable serine/threonine-protein kinase clkA-like [Saccoglossus kowalevskii]